MQTGGCRWKEDDPQTRAAGLGDCGLWAAGPTAGGAAEMKSKAEQAPNTKGAAERRDAGGCRGRNKGEERGHEHAPAPWT